MTAPERTPADASKSRQMWAVLLNLRPGDGLPLVILLAHSFLKGAAKVLLETPANTLFLSRYSIEALPLIYIATAVVCTLIGLLYTRLETRLSVRTLLTATLGFLSVVTLAFYLVLVATDARPAVFGVMVWKDVHWTLMNLEFWALAGLLLDVRQGKRLFGLIAIGEIVAGMAGGFSVPLFIKSGGTNVLVLASALVTIGNVFLLIYTMRRLVPSGAHAESDGEISDRRPWWTLFKDRYLALFFGVSALSFFGEYFIDYLFYEKVERAFASEEKLAAFFGMFYGVLGVGQLISSAWISGRALTRYGLSFGLLALPAAALFTTGAASMTALFGVAAVAVFWSVVAAKFFDELGRHTIEMPAYRILYQPLAPDQRLRVQTVRESMVEPLSIGVVGAMLWAGEKFFGIQSSHVLYLTVVVVIAWAVLCWLLRREYTVRLTRALTARRLGAGGGLALDGSSIGVLEQGFLSAKAGQVIYCLDMLEESRHASLENHLVKLLEHPDALVRRHVLGKIERLNVRAALEPVMRRLPQEESPVVRAAMLQAVCALSEADGIERVIPFLKDAEPSIRRGALVGLLRHCGIDGVLAGGSHLSALLASSEPSERVLAAQVLGDIGITSFHRPLLALLRDPHVSVRLAAIESARQLRTASAIPALMEALPVSALRGAASVALAELGDAALPSLEAAFATGSREVRKAIASICGRHGSEKSAAFLQKHLAHADRPTRTHVLAALVQTREKLGSREVPEARALILREAEEAAWALAAWADVGGAPADAALSRACLSEAAERTQRIFLLLALLHPPGVIRKAQLDLEANAGEKRAHALEVLDNLIAPELKRKIFPLLDQLSPQERFQQLNTVFPQPRLERAARLQEMAAVAQSGAWTKACALFLAGRARAAEWSGAALSALADQEEIVRETAVWTLAQVHDAAFRERAPALQGDPNPAVARLARELVKGGKEPG